METATYNCTSNYCAICGEEKAILKNKDYIFDNNGISTSVKISLCNSCSHLWENTFSDNTKHALSIKEIEKATDDKQKTVICVENNPTHAQESKVADLDTPPLKWYYFHLYVRIPYSILTSLSGFMSNSLLNSSNEEYSSLSGFVFLYILNILFALLSFIGLIRKNKMGFFCNCLFILSSTILSIPFSNSIGITLALCGVGMLAIILQYMYFIKRGYLFFDDQPIPTKKQTKSKRSICLKSFFKNLKKCILPSLCILISICSSIIFSYFYIKPKPNVEKSVVISYNYGRDKINLNTNVVIYKTNNKYHNLRNNCTKVNLFPETTTLREAVRKGYKPCDCLSENDFDYINDEEIY